MVVFLACLVAACLVAVPSAMAQSGKATPVGVDEVRIEPLNQTVPVIGRLVARRAGIVAARTGGPVAEIKVDVGDRVKKGDVVAVLVSERLRWERQLRSARVLEAKAAVKTARARIDLRTQELKRLKGLRGSAAFSQARFEDKKMEVIASESAAAEASAALKRANADLNLADIELKYATIRAPYGGVVSLRHTEIGSYLNRSDPVVTLIDDTSLEIEADVPANRVSGLTADRQVSFRIGASPPLVATVRAVIPEENPRTRTRVVRFTSRLPDNQGYAASQSVTLDLPAGKVRPVVTVHKDAVLNRKGKTMVFIVADESVEIRPVRLGQAVGSRFEVLGGLKNADLVVVRGNERLRPGQKVSFERKL
jgi:RND family efflux transporter MFP subunit